MLSPAEATMEDEEETTSTPSCLAFTSEWVQGLLPHRWPRVQQRRQHAAAHGTQPPARALPVR
uniref:Uncharacterized protein n=1 Tax=Arundo donax TaxID=35708 RepID=A0A0A9H4A3_ARUDO